MSIVCGNSWGWLVDSCTHIDEGLQRCVCYNSAGLEKPTYFKNCFKREYFNILKPHVQIRQNTSILTGSIPLHTAKNSTGDELAKIDLQARKVYNGKKATQSKTYFLLLLLFYLIYCARL